ncbi:carbohydrate binding domain-containing protein [Streptomyces deccanensis]|uniref:carbohydrate binding domain-containing protein n=1 Tax=Streptomyces deccanensis TaxID=424188 RepID=UPI001EFA52D2|nr:carbohydrate binding domain-containing protein [Streptomyces deccanensis]ULR48298.1 carbohydrate binding domain-containing protein [Streptomyces deccanensis]
MRHVTDIRRFVAGLVVTMLLACAAVVLTPAVQAQAAGTSYYVDCSAAANGTGTSGSPWNSLAGPNAKTFAPGDQLLLKRGTTCNGTLHPLGSGSAADGSISIDAYGTGALPIIAAGGATDAIYLHNQEYWEISNLEITNTGAVKGANARRGVYVVLENYGTGNHYKVSNLNIHDVNGNNSKEVDGSAGILFAVLGTTTPSAFDDVVIDGNTVANIARSGINMSSTWLCRPSIGCNNPAWTPWTGVVVRNNTVHDTDGDGIVVQMSKDALIEHNVVYNAAKAPNAANAGIWAWDSDGTVIQYNEAYGTKKLTGNPDGQGFDVDYGQDGTVVQYNYSHDNEGGFLLFCGCGGGSRLSSNAVVRYNVSEDDRLRVVNMLGSQDSQFYNNTIYIPSGSTANVFEVDGAWNDLTLANNLIYNLGSGGYVYTSGQPASNFSWRNNLFYGNHPSSEPTGNGNITGDPLLTSPGSGGTGINSVAGYQISSSSSPAIGAGVVMPDNGGKDYWGSTVPSVCAPDIGADQFSSPSDATCLANENLGFEKGTLTAWSAWNSASVVNSGAHGGTYAVRVGPSPASVENYVPVAPRTTYRVSGWVKSDVAGEVMNVGVKNTGGLETVASASGTAWTFVSADFTTGAANGTVRLYCYKSSGSGNGYCDDLAVTPVKNHVINGNFESGHTVPWRNGDFSLTGTSSNGTAAGLTNASLSGGTLWQLIYTLKPSTTYRLSGAIRSQTAGTATALEAKLYNGSAVTSASTTSSTYSKQSTTFTTGAGVTTARVYCHLVSGSGDGYCDEVTLTEQ